MHSLPSSGSSICKQVPRGKNRCIWADISGVGVKGLIKVLDEVGKIGQRKIESLGEQKSEEAMESVGKT
jgi:hypothetical protein